LKAKKTYIVLDNNTHIYGKTSNFLRQRYKIETLYNRTNKRKLHYYKAGTPAEQSYQQRSEIKQI